MKILLFDRDGKMVEAWRSLGHRMTDLVISQLDLPEVEADAIVSPANSFGFMDGGFDLCLLQRFGLDLEVRVRQLMLTREIGELPVGTANIVDTGCKKTPYLVVAPTMRVPMILPADTVNPYLATKAAVGCAMRTAAPIETLAITGMGTGVGRVPHAIAAWQMISAIREMLYPQRGPQTEWEAQQWHQRLYTDADPVDLQCGHI